MLVEDCGLHSYVHEGIKPNGRILPKFKPYFSYHSAISLPSYSRRNPIMCQYWRVETLCGHSTLLAGPSCYLIYEQFQRINDPAEQGRHDLPFEIPNQCLPSRGNIRRGYVNNYCSWECRNNGFYAERRCGTHDARYGPGSERIGVGWRY
jgi:hypothetical protein